VIDDEPLAQRVIERYAEDISFLEIVQKCDHAMNALDYLMKPFSFERFVRAVQKAQEALRNRELPGDETSQTDLLHFKFLCTRYTAL